MKNLYITILAMAISAITANAGIVTFGSTTANDPVNSWTGYTQSVQLDGSITFSQTTTDGVTFDLNVAGVVDFGGTNSSADLVLFSNGAGGGIFGNQSDTRISNGPSDAATDDQYLVYSLSVTGTPLAALSLDSLRVRYDSNTDDLLKWVDQDGATINLVGNGTYDYSSLTNLSALSIATSETWLLAVGSIDGNGATGVDDGIMAMGPITFDYTVVPEPSTFALLAGLMGLCLVAYRRRG